MTQRTALIVEDDPEFADIIAQILESLEFETEIIDNGGRALERLTQVKPSIIVLDLHLPVFSGDNVLRQIHDDHTLLETRVILVTADRTLAEEYRDQADAVFIKPFHLDDFTGSLRDMFFIP